MPLEETFLDPLSRICAVEVPASTMPHLDVLRGHTCARALGSLFMLCTVACIEPPPDEMLGMDASPHDAGRPRDAAATHDAAITLDATATDASTEDAALDSGTTHSGSVPMFVAVGYGFRRAVSCDDGRTWQHDVVDDPNGDDDATLARGLGYANGLFVAAVGSGGATGRIETSADGVTWKTRVMAGTYNGFSQVAYNAGYYVAGGGHISIRSANGISGWGEERSMGTGGILRHITAGGGKLVAVGGNRIEVSTDGSSWTAANGSCGEPVDLVYGNGRFVGVDLAGNTCVSADGGATWSNGNVGSSNARGIVFTGTQFLVTGLTAQFRSTNGVQWTSSPGVAVEHMAISDTGTIVGIQNGHLVWSANGTTFSLATIPGSAGNRDFMRIVFGYGAASDVCPEP